jgi:hypothetical protein
MLRAALAAALAAAAFAGGAAAGERQYLYVWTAGVDGQSDGSDKLVTIDATLKSERHGKVIHTLWVGDRAELAAFALGADGRALRAARADGKAFEFDLGDPSRPRLRRAHSGAPGGEAPREARDERRLFVAGVPARDEPDAAHFVRAFTRGDDATLTILFEIDFRAPRLGLPRAVVLLDR